MSFTPHNFKPGELIQSEPFNETERQIATNEANINTKVPKTTKVNNKALTGDITLDKSDVGLGNVDNTSDADKPISSATQTALNGKVPSSREINGYSLDEDIVLTKADVGLGNVDNTSDTNKPISNATQTALNTKVDKTTTINGHSLSSNVTITKGDIGLGNVDNTSDLNKPVSTATQNALNSKVDKVEGKVLSTNDYTTTEKNKLAGIEENANNYVLPKASSSNLGGIIVGDNLTIDSNGRISAVQGSYTLPIASDTQLGGIKVGTNLSIDSDGKLSATDTTYSDATTSAHGLMTAADKIKLNGIEEEANKTTVDSTLSSSSTNPVQNKVIDAALGNKVDKVTGKGLSTNDYTTTEKNKLAGIEENANNYILPKASNASLGGIIVGDNLTIDSDGRMSAVQGAYTLPIASDSQLGGVKVGTNLSINDNGVLSATDTTYNDATTSEHGLMTAADKTKLNSIDMSTKVNEPSIEGTSGQVLTTDGHGGRTWTTVSGGSGAVNDVQVNGTSIVDEDGVADIDMDAKINEPSSEGTSGQVLTTDGNGGRSWTTVSAGAELGLSIVNGKLCITYEE